MGAMVQDRLTDEEQEHQLKQKHYGFTAELQHSMHVESTRTQHNCNTVHVQQPKITRAQHTRNTTFVKITRAQRGRQR